MSDGLLGDLRESVRDEVLERTGRLAGQVQESTPLAADLLESDDAYLVVFDSPGATERDVQVSYVDGAVLVRVDRFREFRDGFETLFPGRGMALDGRVRLPADAVVDPEAATATLRADGTLAVELPKRHARTDDDTSEADHDSTDDEEASHDEADESAADA